MLNETEIVTSCMVFSKHFEGYQKEKKGNDPIPQSTYVIMHS